MEPLRRELIAEVAYDHMQQDRFWHTAQFRRWRTDKKLGDCTYAQRCSSSGTGSDFYTGIDRVSYVLFYCTVSETVVLCCIPPELPLTVML